ncbi:1-deoxy-D-xylulose 5-phosphate reductoisomerase [bacterium HR15]|nr:1-deoxy-D-xylulose 5-phosphate reductoisomerase [bacterium HR15]
MKRVAILGSTGSIGQQALDVIGRLPERLQVVALAAHSNLERLLEQAEMFRVEAVGLLCPPQEAQKSLPERLERAGKWLQLYTGVDGLCELVRRADIDIVVVALTGIIALKPTLAAIESGKTIALSTKEVLVGAGEYVMQQAHAYGVAILPIDSEHSGAFQILQERPLETVERLILTASGGPFRQRPLETFESITVQEALQHPNWRMGPKITVDSATMMNKGLEVIEAHWLFGLPLEQIEVLIHPQSIVHALVEFRDGSVLAQLSVPDMRLPIQYALLYPERVDTELPRLRLEQVRLLEFEAPDLNRYPCLGLAYEAARIGGTMPAVLNAANEVAVQLFLQEQIPFAAIPALVEQTMRAHEPREATLQAVLEADAWAREYVQVWRQKWY